MALLGAGVIVALAHPLSRGTRHGRRVAVALCAASLAQTGLDSLVPFVSQAGHMGGLLAGAFFAVLALVLAALGRRLRQRLRGSEDSPDKFARKA